MSNQKRWKPYRQEIQSFIDTAQRDILYKILRLFALALEIPDEKFFVKLHNYNRHDESWYR